MKILARSPSGPLARHATSGALIYRGIPIPDPPTPPDPPDDPRNLKYYLQYQITNGAMFYEYFNSQTLIVNDIFGYVQNYPYKDYVYIPSLTLPRHFENGEWLPPPFGNIDSQYTTSVRVYFQSTELYVQIWIHEASSYPILIENLYDGPWETLPPTLTGNGGATVVHILFKLSWWE